MIADPHERAFPDKLPIPYVVCCQTRSESAWEWLTHSASGMGYQVLCEFLIAPWFLMEPYHFPQAILNMAIYVPVRFVIGYALRRRFVGNLASYLIPIPRSSEQAMQLVLQADSARFRTEIELDEIRRERDALRLELTALIGEELQRTPRP